MAQENSTNQPRTIGSSLAQHWPSKTPSTENRTEKIQQLAGILGALAMHYWRPDFTPAQAKVLMGDYLEDLSECAVQDVADACRLYRRQKDAQFFPKIGELLALVDGSKRDRIARENTEAEAARRAAASPGGVAPAPSDWHEQFERSNRPHCWYMRPRSTWKPEWREADVPSMYRSFIR